MAKHEIHSCDICGQSKEPVVEISYYVGYRFNGVDTDYIWDSKEFCFDCLVFHTLDKLASVPEVGRNSYMTHRASRDVWKQVKSTMHSNKVVK